MTIPVAVYTELVLLMMSSKPARNLLRLINEIIVKSASCWFILYGFIRMQVNATLYSFLVFLVCRAVVCYQYEHNGIMITRYLG